MAWRGSRHRGRETAFYPRNVVETVDVRPMMGWLSAVLLPVIRMQSVFSISAIEFVIAPLPNAAARPATVTECHNRAQ